MFQDKLKFVIILGIGVLLNSEVVFGQAVSINSTGTAPHPDAILDISTTGNQGILLTRMGTATRIAWTPTANGVTVYDTDTQTYWYWDGVWREIPNTAGIITTLDGAYDGGSSGGGRSITVDAGSVQMNGTSGSVALETDGDIQLTEDQWIGLGSTVERIEFDGSLNRIDIEAADLTMGNGRWIGIDASNPRILFEGGTTDRVTIEDADVRIDNNKWFGLGSTIERFEFQGSDGEVNLMGAEFGIGTLAPTEALDVNGQIRMRAGAAIGYIPVSNATGVMTWTDPTTIATADVTLDEAYDANGPGLGRTITADNGPVDIQGPAGLLVAGNVGIGTTDQTHRLVVNGTNSDTSPILSLRSGNDNGAFNNGAQIGLGYNGTTDYSHFIHTRHNSTGGVGNAIDFYLSDGSVAGNSVTSASVQVMTLAGTGNVGIGTTSPSVKLEVIGDATITGKFNSNGIQESSDRRFKRDITPLVNVLENLMEIDGVSYKWRRDEFPNRNFSNRTEIGVIAQEIEKIYPELVSTDNKGYKAVQYSHLAPILIEAIKEQQVTINSLNGTVTDLSSALSTMTKQMQTIQVQVNRIQSDINTVVTGTEVSSKTK